MEGHFTYKNNLDEFYIDGYIIVKISLHSERELARLTEPYHPFISDKAIISCRPTGLCSIDDS